MFHLYFGGFDVLLYLGGIYGAIALSKALCDQMDAAEVAQSSTAETGVAPMQPIPEQIAPRIAPHLVAPAAKREEVSVRVSVN